MIKPLWQTVLLEQLPNDTVYFDETISQYTTFHTGGKVDALCLPQTTDDIINILMIAKQYDVPVYVFGNGSNLLVRDGGIRGIVVFLRDNYNKITVDAAQKKVCAQAGASMIGVVNSALEHHLTGLEFAGGIPGTVGGAVIMNAGAYTGCIANFLYSVTYIDANLQVQNRVIEATDMGYRKTIFSDNGWIILEACFVLEAGDVSEAKERLKEFNERRRTKQPVSARSAGSTFKRPEGHFAGQLIELAGCKGMRVGGACVSTLHAGFIINDKHATADDVEQLIKQVQKKVFENSGILLETEVKIVGEKA